MSKEIMVECGDMSIGDVSRLCDVPVHTIRYWEKEFSFFLQPLRTPGKQRRYNRESITRLTTVRKLLWENRFSIEGARMVLRNSFPCLYADTTAGERIDTFHPFLPGILTMPDVPTREAA